jgi:hypothetical protein
MIQGTMQATPAASATKPDDRATTFQPVEGGSTEQHSGTTLLVEAYTVLWVILLAWVLFMWRRQATLGARVGELEKALDRAAAKRDAKA